MLELVGLSTLRRAYFIIAAAAWIVGADGVQVLQAQPAAAGVMDMLPAEVL